MNLGGGTADSWPQKGSTMQITGGSRNRSLALCILLSLTVLLAWGIMKGLPAAQAQRAGWSEPVNISNTPNSSWFPDLVVDGLGNIHVVWCETRPGEVEGTLTEQVYYVSGDGQTWTEPNDIVPPSNFIHRNAIALSPTGELLMVFREAGRGYGIFFTAAPSQNAWSAAAWSPPRLVNVHGNSYMADMAVDSQGTVHLILDDAGDPDSEICPGCADIYYRRSTDNGRTWSSPVNLARTPTGSSREQMEIDSRGVIHVAWDEGWDRLSGRGRPIYGAYTFSSDGGLSWSTPITVAYPTTTTAQLAVGADGVGGVMLVWRTTDGDAIFYQWSTDNGTNWSSPDVVPGVFARPWTIPFDMYDMAADSAGHIHLLVVGRESQSRDAPLGVYHLVWDGASWSSPERIYLGEGLPEYPKIVVSHGNRLHAVWFVRDTLWQGGNYEVWYSSSQSDAPYQTPVPSPMPTVTPTNAPTATPMPTPTPYPTIVLSSSAPPTGLYTENDEVLRVVMAVTPVLLILLLTLVFRRLRR